MESKQIAGTRIYNGNVSTPIPVINSSINPSINPLQFYKVSPQSHHNSTQRENKTIHNKNVRFNIVENPLSSSELSASSSTTSNTIYIEDWNYDLQNYPKLNRTTQNKFKVMLSVFIISFICIVSIVIVALT